MTAILIDTNVLVYAHDRGEHAKQGAAILLLNHLQSAGTGRLSVQCLAEFIKAITRSPFPWLNIEDATRQVEWLIHSFPVFDLTPLVVVEAARAVKSYQLSYYDAQIWASARLNQVPVIFSEDFADHAILEGIRFVNPFAADFKIEEWA